MQGIGRLLELIRAQEILVMPGVFDGFSARLVKSMGFESAFITGSGVSESRVGQPDVGIMGLAENLDATRMLVECSGLSLIADADTGYGNAVNVHFTVQRFEQAGAAGVMIEDQVSPKRCGHLAGKEVIDADEMVGKIRSAVDARRSSDFVIKARTDAAVPLGLDEAIRRANLYAEAGADLVFADALLSVDDIRHFTRSVSAPVAINMGFGIRTRSTTPLVSPAQLQDLGVAVVEYPRLLTACAVQGMIHGLNTLVESMRTGEVIERPDLLVSFDELNDLMGLLDIRNLEEKYLTEAQYAAKYRQSTPLVQPTSR
jgi:2-methylisocitrate lyase-like PEP mutase family enzyme